MEAWVHSQNMDKGITPRSAVVWERSHALRMQHQVPFSTRKRKKYAFQWLRCWRRKWAATVSSMAPSEMLTVPQLQEKAPHTNDRGRTRKRGA